MSPKIRRNCWNRPFNNENDGAMAMNMIEHHSVEVGNESITLLCDMLELLQSYYIPDMRRNIIMLFNSNCPLKRIEAGPSKIKLLFITTQRRNSLESVKLEM